MKTKFIFITGGVVSSLGKGISASAMGAILKSAGLKIYMQKFDPYINVDAANLSPLQHGEVFVTEDGAETDLDLGHYERFIETNLTKFASVSQGKIYRKVLKNEREGRYNGRTVQVVPHITDEIKSRLTLAAKHSGADIIITEIGGTVGDIESLPFLEAIRQFRREYGSENTMFIHTTLVPYIRASRELKTKPTQHSVKELRSYGIIPDILILRSETKLNKELKKKVASYCDVDDDKVIDMVDVKNIYNVIPNLKEQDIDGKILKHFNLKTKKPTDISPWLELIERIENSNKEFTIAVVGSFVTLHDSYLSVIESVKHAGFKEKAIPKFVWINSTKIKEEELIEELNSVDAIIIPGGNINKEPLIEYKTLEYAATKNIPLLGICLGMELMVIERLRNKGNIKDATSEEFTNIKGTNVYVKIKAEKPILGARDIQVKEGSIIHKIYRSTKISERFRFKYIFNNKYLEKLEKTGLVVDATLKDPLNLAAVSDPSLDFFVGVQYHPEYKSRPLTPHNLFLTFVKKILERKKNN